MVKVSPATVYPDNDKEPIIQKWDRRIEPLSVPSRKHHKKMTH